MSVETLNGAEGRDERFLHRVARGVLVPEQSTRDRQQPSAGGADQLLERLGVPRFEAHDEHLLRRAVSGGGLLNVWKAAHGSAPVRVLGGSMSGVRRALTCPK